MLIDGLKLRDAFGVTEISEWLEDNVSESYKLFIDAIINGSDDIDIHANTVAIYNQIHADDKLRKKFIKLLKNYYPEILVNDEKSSQQPNYAKLIVSANDHDGHIFKYYNPSTLRFPMQIIFKSDDTDELQNSVTEFTTKLKSEHRIIIDGQFAYIEYIPTNHASLVDKIPDNNWEIPVENNNGK